LVMVSIFLSVRGFQDYFYKVMRFYWHNVTLTQPSYFQNEGYEYTTV
jgi:hypothetical protein